MASYGGYLRFTLEFTADEDGGRPYRDVDVEIIVSFFYPFAKTLLRFICFLLVFFQKKECC